MSFLGKLKQLNGKKEVGGGDDEEVELNLGLSLHGKFGIDKYSTKLIRSTSVANLVGPMIPKSDGTLSLLTLVRSSSFPTTESEIPMFSDGIRRRSEVGVTLDLKLNLDESQYGGGSGLDYESKLAQGSSSGGQSISPGSNREIGSSKIPGLMKNPFVGPAKNKGEASGSEKMPCVYTRGDGPNGRRVNGILYKYEKGDEVKIMCVCHGSFLSPAEFIKHAGGSDVEHPLKHIVISHDYDAFM